MVKKENTKEILNDGQDGGQNGRPKLLLTICDRIWLKL